MSRYIPTNYDDEHPITWTGHLVKHGPRKTHDRLMDFAQVVLKDEDLSEKGKARLIAKQAAELMAEFRGRQAALAEELSDARTAASYGRNWVMAL